MTLSSSNQAITRENELKRYFQEKINELVYKSNKLSGQSNTYAIEVGLLDYFIGNNCLFYSNVYNPI